MKKIKKMKNDKTQNEDFLTWYTMTSSKAGHLITPKMAAQLLDVHKQYIDALHKQGKIKKHYYGKQPYIGMNDINMVIIERNTKYKHTIFKRAQIILNQKMTEDEKTEKLREYETKNI